MTLTKKRPFVALVLVLAIGACAQPSWDPTAEQKAMNTIEAFKEADPYLESFFNDAEGYAVFPKIGKGAILLGGAYGEGTVYERGRIIGASSVTKVDLGLQLGSKSFSQVVFFKNQEALEGFVRSLAKEVGRRLSNLGQGGLPRDSGDLVVFLATPGSQGLTGRVVRACGGAFIGVGPDQGFAYIAQVRPNVAFMIDIRRDNLLQHLFFKTLFTSAQNRLEYLCLLFGKPIPDDLDAWNDADILALTEYIDETTFEAEDVEAARALVGERVEQMGITLSERDLETIGRIHNSFLDEGLDLQFTSHGRPPRFYYPNYRDLLLEKDLTGRRGAFLAREDDFQFIKTMQEEDRMVPVVGDLSGPSALAAIRHYLEEQGEHVSAFYTSNVEFYLMRGGSFDRFVENVKQLPHTEESVIIRSYFNRFTSNHPQTVSGYASTQLLQTIESLVAEHENGGYQSYWDLITKHSLELR